MRLTKAQTKKRMTEAIKKLSVVLAFGTQYMSTQDANKLYKLKNEIFTIQNRIK